MSGGFQQAGAGSIFAQAGADPEGHYQTVQGNGTDKTQRSKLNFGSGLSVTDDSANDRTTVSATTDTDNYQTVQDAGVVMTQRPVLNFTDGILVADDGANSSTDVGVDGTVVRTTRLVSAGTGLSGGGALSADRTLSLDTAHGNTWTKAQGVAAVALVDGATINTDASLGNVFTVTLAGNRTLANPTNLVAGFTYIWILTQDATGSRLITWGSKFKFPAATQPTLSTAANAVDVISAVYDGTNLLCVSAIGEG